MLLIDTSTFHIHPIPFGFFWFFNKMKKILIAALIFQLFAIVCYFYFVYQARNTENLGPFLHYSYYAGFAVYSAIGMWLITLVAVIKSKVFTAPQGKFVVLISPFTAIVGWLLVRYLWSE